VQPSQPVPVLAVLSQTRAEAAGRTTPRPVALARPTPTPTPTSPVCARACPGLCPNARFSSPARQPQNLNRKNYPQRNLSWDFPQIRNKRVTNLRPCSTPMNTFPHCRSHYQTEPPAPCQLKACRAEPSPEGGCPSRSAAAGADYRAGAPPKDAPPPLKTTRAASTLPAFLHPSSPL
jgi:hypothetical protein